MLCPKCGSQESSGMRFCSKCGTPLQAGTPGAQFARPTNAAPARGRGAKPLSQGAMIAPNGQVINAPKRNPLAIAGIALITVAALALYIFLGSTLVGALGLSGKSGVLTTAEVREKVPNAASKPVEEQKSAPLQGDVPEKLVVMPSSSGYQLVDLDLKTVNVELPVPPDSGMENKWLKLGSFSEGYAVGVWEVLDYDKEWEVMRSTTVHVGLFDAEGKLAKELTQSILDLGFDNDSLVATFEYGGAMWISEYMCPFAYSEGRLVLWLSYANVLKNSGWGNYYYADVIVFDKSGGLVFHRNNVLPAHLGPGGVYYSGGVLGLTEYDTYRFARSVLIDVDGNELVSSRQCAVASLGYGLYEAEDDSAKVFSYDGDVVFDVTSLATDGVLSPHLVSISTRSHVDRGYGFIPVLATLKNPYGGDDKSTEGLYNLTTKEWTVSLSSEFYLHGSAFCHGGIISFAADRDDEAWSFANTKNNVLLDSDTVQNTLGLSGYVTPRYIGDGFWYSAKKSENRALFFYFENEEYKGMKVVRSTDSNFFSGLSNSAWYG